MSGLLYSRDYTRNDSVTTRVCRLWADSCSHSSLHPSFHFLVYREVKRSPGGANKRKRAASCWVLWSQSFLSVIFTIGVRKARWMMASSAKPGSWLDQDSKFYSICPWGICQASVSFYIQWNLFHGIIARTDCKKSPVEYIPLCLTQGNIQSMESFWSRASERGLQMTENYFPL